jgi:hypothetical protein
MDSKPSRSNVYRPELCEQTIVRLSTNDYRIVLARIVVGGQLTETSSFCH